MSGEAPAVWEALPVYITEAPETEIVPSGYRQTEVGVIPEDWEQTTIGERTIKVGSGITPTGGSRVYKQAGRAFLRSQNVGWGQLLIDEIAYIDEQTHESFEETEIKIGDVLLNITGASIGRSAIADHRVEGGNVNQHVCIIRPKEKQLDPRFLNSFLVSSSGQRQIDSFQAGGNREGLNFMQIKSFLLPLPPLPEQRAIAAALWDVDALISALDKLIAKKRAVKTAAMQQLLTGEQRLPGFTGEWETHPLMEITQNPVTDGPHLTPKFLSSGIPFLSVNNLVDNKIDLSALRYISLEDHKLFSKKCKPKRGDILLGKAASVGNVAIVDYDMEFNIWSPIALIRVADKHIPGFIYYCFQSRKLVIQIELLTNSSSQGNIGMGDIEKLEFLLPCIEEQTAIAAVLSDMDAEIGALEARREKTRRIKQGMMQELLTGRTRLV